MKQKQTHRLTFTREQASGYQRDGQVVRDKLGVWDT